MSASASSVLEVFQLNKNSKEDDLEQCIAWLRDVFHDNLPKTISVVVKRLGGYDPLNQTNLSKSTLKGFGGLNSTVNASMMNNTLVGNQSFNGRNGSNQNKNESFTENNKQAKKSSENPPNSQRAAADYNENQKGVNNQQNAVGRPDQSQQNNEHNFNQQQNNEDQQQSSNQNDDSHPNNNSIMSEITNASFNSKTYNENDPHSVSEKAKHFYLNQHFNEALDLYQKSQNLAMNDEESNIKLIFQNKIYIGSILAQAKARKQAIEELKSAFEMRNRFNVSEIIEANEQNSKEGNHKVINSNPLYFIQLTLGNLYNEEKDLDQAIYFFEEALKEIKNAHTITDRKNQALILNTLGMIYYSKNNIIVSIEKFKESLLIFEGLMKLPECAKDPQLKSSYANRLNNLGEAFRRNKQIEEAINNFQESLKLKIEAKLENNDESMETEKSIASTHNNLGMSYFSIKRYDEAIEHLNLAIEKYETKIGKSESLDKLSFANILNQRGDCYRAKQNLLAACDDYKKSYKLKQDCLGNEHKSTISTLNYYAQLLFSTKNFAKSKQAFTELLQAQIKLFGERDLQVGQTLNNLGTVLSENQEYELAEEKIKQAIEIFQESKMAEQNLERVQKNLAAIQQKKERKNQQRQQQEQH